MTRRTAQRGAISLLAVFVVTVAAATLSAAAAAYHLGKASTIMSDYSRAPVEAGKDAPDWNAVEKGHLRYAQQAMAHAALAAKSAVEFAGSPSSQLDVGYNLVGLGTAIHESADSDAPSDVPTSASDEAAAADPLAGDQPEPQPAPAEDEQTQVDAESTDAESTDAESTDSNSNGDSPDGTFYARPTGDAAFLVRAGELEWDPAGNYVVVDTTGSGDLTVDGLISNGPDPATGAGFTTQYQLWSTELPWWDDQNRVWEVAVMASRDGGSPELVTATISPAGTFSLLYDIGAFPVEVHAVRDG